MTYRFRSKACDDVPMLQRVGDRLLTAMGLARAARGIIAPEAVPAALATLEAAIARDEVQTADPMAVDDVSLRQRARPLVQMLQAAAARHEAIVWGA